MEKNFLLILFYSASGSVKNLAHAIADGAEEVGMEVRIRTCQFLGYLRKMKRLIQKYLIQVRFTALKMI